MTDFSVKVDAKELHVTVYGAKVKGSIVYGCDPACLDSDMLQVALDNEIVIDLGWVPDGDANGAYRVVAYRGHFLSKVAKTTFYKDPILARDAVEKLAGTLRLRQKPGLTQGVVKFASKVLTMPYGQKINRNKRRTPDTARIVYVVKRGGPAPRRLESPLGGQ